MLKKSIILIIFLIVSNCLIYGEIKIEKINIDILGINLGCDYNEFLVYLENYKEPKILSDTIDEVGVRTIVVLGNNRIKPASVTALMFYENKLVSFNLYFFNLKSREKNVLLDALRSQLEKRYNRRFRSSDKILTYYFELPSVYVDLSEKFDYIGLAFKHVPGYIKIHRDKVKSKQDELGDW